MIAFRQFLEKFTICPEADWKIIEENFEKKIVLRNQILVSEGEICKYFYFIEKGLFRFYITNEGEEVTKFFTAAPNCMTITKSFRNQIPSSENLQAIEDSIVWYIHFSKIEELMKLSSWNSFIRKFSAQVQEFTEELLIETITKTAEQRYISLNVLYPEIIHKIPLKYLSSFLGIAPQSLSRIRKKIHDSRKS